MLSCTISIDEKAIQKYLGKKISNDDFTELGGGCISAGVGGSIVGFGADLLLIDDYCKGHEEAESKTQREKLWNWWQSVASSRLHPNSVNKPLNLT